MKSDLLTLELCYIVDMYIVSVEAWAQGIILLACGPCGYCKLLGQVLYLG